MLGESQPEKVRFTYSWVVLYETSLLISIGSIFNGKRSQYFTTHMTKICRGHARQPKRGTLIYYDALTLGVV